MMRGVVADALDRPPDGEARPGDAGGVGTVEAQQLGHEPLVVAASMRAAGR